MMPKASRVRKSRAVCTCTLCKANLTRNLQDVLTQGSFRLTHQLSMSTFVVMDSSSEALPQNSQACLVTAIIQFAILQAFQIHTPSAVLTTTAKSVVLTPVMYLMTYSFVQRCIIQAVGSWEQRKSKQTLGSAHWHVQMLRMLTHYSGYFTAAQESKCSPWGPCRVCMVTCLEHTCRLCPCVPSGHHGVTLADLLLLQL